MNEKKIEIKEIKKFCPFIKDICKGKECMMYKMKKVKFTKDNKYKMIGYCGFDISGELSNIQFAVESSNSSVTLDVSGIVGVLDDLGKTLSWKK